MTKKIKLTKGKYAIVDKDNFDLLNRHKWYFSGYYAVRTVYPEGGKPKIVMMHREIAGTPEGNVTDHINGNKLDNRMSNLRICVMSQNVKNQKVRKNNTSGYKGVSWHATASKWWAHICSDYKLISLGLYFNKEDAAKAYNSAALKYHGNFAVLNQLT